MTYQIPMHEVSEDFADCWRSAGHHLRSMTASLPNGTFGFFNASLSPPFLEHISFRLVNQIFFVFLEDHDQDLVAPSGIEQTEYAARLANGVPCILPMHRTSEGWETVYEGWGLVDTKTRRPINPPSLTSTTQIVISDWELQDFSVQVVRRDLETSGAKILSTNSNPSVTPSIFFVTLEGTRCFAQVVSSRHPHPPQVDLAKMMSMKKRLSAHTDKAFAALVLVSGKASDELFRGDQYLVKFEGLQEIC